MSVNTTPATWVAGESPTATKLNTEIRDFATAAQAAWDAYTPTWSTTGTAPVLGNGTLTGRYYRQGKTIHFVIRLTAGSTTTFGTTGFSFTLPFAPSAAYTTDSLVGHALCVDSSPIARYGGRSVFMGSGSTVFVVGPSNDYVQNTTPFTWATGDTLVLSGTYEAA